MFIFTFLFYIYHFCIVNLEQPVLLKILKFRVFFSSFDIFFPRYQIQCSEHVANEETDVLDI